MAVYDGREVQPAGVRSDTPFDFSCEFADQYFAFMAGVAEQQQEAKRMAELGAPLLEQALKTQTGEES